jgi:hypothetical protein
MRLIKADPMWMWELCARHGAMGPWSRDRVEYASGGSLYLLDLPISGPWYHLPHVSLDSLPQVRPIPVLGASAYDEYRGWSAPTVIGHEYDYSGARVAYYPNTNARTPARVTTIIRYLSSLGMSEDEAKAIIYGADGMTVDLIRGGERATAAAWVDAFNHDLERGSCPGRPCLMHSCMMWPASDYDVSTREYRAYCRVAGLPTSYADNGQIKPATIAYWSPDFGALIARDSAGRIIGRAMVNWATKARAPLYTHPREMLNPTQADHDMLAECIDKVSKDLYGIKRAHGALSGCTFHLMADCASTRYVSESTVIPYLDDDLYCDECGTIGTHGAWYCHETSGRPTPNEESEPDYYADCCACDTGLGEDDSVYCETDGQTYCADCYNDAWARCAECEAEVSTDDLVQWPDEDEASGVRMWRGPSAFYRLESVPYLRKSAKCLCESCRPDYTDDYSVHVAQSGKLRVGFFDNGLHRLQCDSQLRRINNDATSYFMTGLGFTAPANRESRPTDYTPNMIAAGAFDGRPDDLGAYVARIVSGEVRV